MTIKFEDRSCVNLENEGQKIFGILHLPLTNQPCPAILMCHGLAGNRTGRTRQYVFLSEQLAKLGIGSLRIDFRGSGDSEGSLSEMTLEGEVTDSLCGLDYLQSHPKIDKERLGLFGRSLGGLVSVLTAARYGGIKSLATWAALYDAHQWVDFREKAMTQGVSDAERYAMTSFNGQTPSEEFFSQLFSANTAEALQSLHDIPMLNIHGIDDPVVTIEHAYRYRAARERSLEISEFIQLATSEHDFGSKPAMEIAINKTCEWFKNTL